MIDEKRLRARIQRAIGYEPPSAAFGTQPAFRALARANAQSRQHRQPRPMLLGFVAALIAFAIVMSLVLAGQAMRSRSSVPVHTGPAQWARPTAITTQPCKTQCEVATESALQPKLPAVPQCGSGTTISCAVQTPVFATPGLGWITDSIVGRDGPAFLYRTDDAGHRWRPVLSWDGPGAQQIRSSVDGREALVVTAWNSQNAATAFYTTDSGAHWTARGLPLGFDSDLVYFANPREGWILRAANLDLVHTTDAGSHWTRIARLDGMTRGGTLLFSTSSDGLYLQGPSLYTTHDGGATWGVQTPPRPSGVSARAYVGHSSIKFFNSHDGVIELDYCTAIGCQSPSDYVYATSDAGTQWTTPLRLPATEGSRNIFIFIDLNHWIGMSGGTFNAHSVIRTADAGQHWTVLLSPAASSNVVQGQWDMVEYPDFFDALHGWSVNEPFLFLTSDGGITWVRQDLPG